MSTVTTMPGVALPGRGSPIPERLTQRQKAAVFILQLPAERSIEILAHLNDYELERLSTEIAQMGTIPPQVARDVLSEISQHLNTNAMRSVQGGINAARDLLEQALGVDVSRSIIDRIARSFVEPPFEFLYGLDPRQIVTVLSEEHPQTVAVVLVHLPGELASQILGALVSDLQANVSRRIAVMDSTSPDLIRTLEKSLQRRIFSLGVSSDLAQAGGLQSLVDIINRSDRATERLILEDLATIDSALAEKVRGHMFMFEDIASVDDRTIQLLLRRVQLTDVATALKGSTEALRAKFMKNMSARSSLMLAEEIDSLGPVRVSLVEEAQSAIVQNIRVMEESGEIVLARGEDDEFVA